jgi:hypothetical protein
MTTMKKAVNTKTFPRRRFRPRRRRRDALVSRRVHDSRFRMADTRFGIAGDTFPVADARFRVAGVAPPGMSGEPPELGRSRDSPRSSRADRSVQQFDHKTRVRFRVEDRLEVNIFFDAVEIAWGELGLGSATRKHATFTETRCVRRAACSPVSAVLNNDCRSSLRRLRGKRRDGHCSRFCRRSQPQMGRLRRGVRG